MQNNLQLCHEHFCPFPLDSLCPTLPYVCQRFDGDLRRHVPPDQQKNRCGRFLDMHTSFKTFPKNSLTEEDGGATEQQTTHNLNWRELWPEGEKKNLCVWIRCKFLTLETTRTISVSELTVGVGFICKLLSSGSRKNFPLWMKNNYTHNF